MPEVHEITTYKFDELSDTAKERAVSDLRNSEGFMDHEWWDSTYDDFLQICEIMGVHITSDRRSTSKKALYFSGFWSQGDGASFEGSYGYKAGFLKKLKEYAPKDEELHKIGQRLFDLQKKNFYSLNASIDRHSSRYVHEGTMDISVGSDLDRNVSEATEDELIDTLRDLARWLYRKLEKEYEYLTSDEILQEHLKANEYDFTADGKIW